MRVNGCSYHNAMNDLPAVKRFRRRHPPGLIRYDLILRRLHLPGRDNWALGDVPGDDDVAVLDGEGRDLLKLYAVISADDSTPQFPGGEPGMLTIMVDDDDNPLPPEWQKEFDWSGDSPKEGRPRLAHIRAPGIKICRKG